jgi:hypothetical protein
MFRSIKKVMRKGLLILVSAVGSGSRGPGELGIHVERGPLSKWELSRDLTMAQKPQRAEALSFMLPSLLHGCG